MRSRASAVRTRAIIRAWEYRQRHLSAGVWFRLRRVLADARTAYMISEAEARRLETEGYEPEPCGAEVVPPKTWIFVDEPRLARIPDRREVPPGLSPQLLAAPAVALVRF